MSYNLETAVGPIARIGALDGDAVVDLKAAHAMLGGPGPFPDDMLALLRLEEPGMAAARAAFERGRGDERARVRLSEVTLRSPLPRPNSIRDFMLIEEHVKGSFPEVPPEWYELPVYWKGNPDTVFGPGDEIRWPTYTDKLDYELELCAVIGRRCRNVTEQEAQSYIAGYSIFNDWSARDIQMREMSVGLGPGLGKDFATSIGPALVTSDEISVTEVALEARINGEVWSSGTLGAMRFSFEQVVADLSREQPLHPGDVLGSGTMGRGCGLELDRWIADGDIVELEAEGIGVLHNRVRRS